MKIDILTLFPNMFNPLFESIIGRAGENGKLDINVVDIREFSKDKHKKCDDTPFGGGAGMVMTAQPIFDAIKSVMTENSKLVYLSPKGEVFRQQKAIELSKENHLIFLCGHYEGIDERILEIFKPLEISIGDYVLTGGELPAMVVVDAIARNVEGVLSSDSLSEESHSNGLLEYPQYTRPQVFEGLEVPAVLLSGNHEEIRKWRQQKSIEITKQRRGDMLKCKK
ncbi:MAG: tRNA (guanosine(37)-N1)-methyltransferase TrmD [Firmicutes bacterium]|nr:tRNA (guanosine(37)-N1)-methyltransferase TrmD [Bacillota bacterium]MDY3658994.1 tRNA (guanosine(37)-N1)-methyltransferase TrmD [Eubacteriales bacterium]